MSIFSIFSKKNACEVHIEDCLRKAPAEVLRQLCSVALGKDSPYDEARDLPRLVDFFTQGDPRLIGTVAAVPEAAWKFFRELVTDGGKVLTLSLKNPNGFETAMAAMESLALLPYFSCEAPDLDMAEPKEGEVPDLTFKFAVAEEVRSTFNRHLKAMDRDYAAWTNLWKLACALVKFQGVCPSDEFIGLARDRFRLTLPEHFFDSASNIQTQLVATVSLRNRLEKGDLTTLADAFILPKLENMRGVADNIRQRRAGVFADAPNSLPAFVKFADAHALSDADLHLEDATGQAVRTQLVGRNDLCPCGSGKKFKKCCGR